jgi:tRNA nucleotidyltransferase (CCA-adding enzyme)
LVKIYLVGGAVRDALMGRPVRDCDYVVLGASEADFLARFPGAKRLGHPRFVYIFHGDEYSLAEGMDLQTDLSRRDLTINALARDDSGVIYQHPGALADLNARVLRPVAEKNFFDDPLRVYRAARFAAMFPDFRVSAALTELMRAVAGSGALSGLAAERVGQEVLRACPASQPGRFLALLGNTGALSPWLAELESADTVPAGPAPYHDESLLAHVATVMNRLAGDPLQVWMGLCHDLGKTATDRRQWPSHHRHDRIGEPVADALGRRLKLSNRFIQAGRAAARYHMAAGDYDRLRPGTRVRLLTSLHRQGLAGPLFELVFADKSLDFRRQAAQDLQRMLAVSLPVEHRGDGRRSGMVLHQLRCRALARRR